VTCAVTYEELAAFASGDLGATRQAEIRDHLPQCNRCRKRLASVHSADHRLTTLLPVPPPGRAILAARRAVSEVTRGAQAPEIMTLDEVAEFLRITPEQLGQVVEELPAFELAGQIRVRRARLVEWIQQRERVYTKRSAESEIAGILAGTL
jgi:hypothetical protein